jgi:hypothetical protein
MGKDKWEVSVWMVKLNKWDYELIYSGDSLLKAVMIMWKQRLKFGCIKLEWRPEGNLCD